MLHWLGSGIGEDFELFDLCGHVIGFDLGEVGFVERYEDVAKVVFEGVPELKLS